MNTSIYGWLILITRRHIAALDEMSEDEAIELGKLLIASGDVDARERLNEGLPTSGLLVIDFVGSNWSKLHPRSGRLERFITPRLLRADAD